MFVAGMKAIPADLATVVEVIQPGEFLKARDPGGRGSVLVLGDDALTALDPGTVANALHAPSCLCIAVPKRIPYSTASRWERIAGIDLVEVEDWEARVAADSALPLRAALDPAAWVPEVRFRDPVTEDIVRRIPLLEDLSPCGLAQALDTEPHRLRRWCQVRFRRKPRELVWAYTGAYVRRRVKEGASRTAVALETGRPDERSLRKAFKGRGEALPPTTREKGTPS